MAGREGMGKKGRAGRKGNKKVRERER